MAQVNARAPKGTADMLPDTARVWERLTRIAATLFSRYGYEPVYTPLFEHTDVFVRGIGEATDIVGKEMYTFLDKGDRSITLRPEGTASVVRAALEHGLTSNGRTAKFYYSGPMFRYERPQAGRMRQFWQIGIEALGVDRASADAEVIALLVRFFDECGIPRHSTRLLINSMGDEACRPAYRETIKRHILDNASDLCEECVRRAETNPLRAFDCKQPGCEKVMASAPLLRDSLCDDCASHYGRVKAYLDELGISYVEDASLVRGLDYYTRTVFEVQAEGLGAQNAIGGGGRYDRLMETFGGAPTPGLGFAIGFERTLLAMKASGADLLEAPRVFAFVARAVPEVAGDAFLLADKLREEGVPTELDHQERSLKSQFKLADRIGARYVVVIGPDELATGQANLRDMSDGSEERVAVSDVPSVLAARAAEPS